MSTKYVLRVSYPGDDGYTFETVLDEKTAQACYMQARLIHGPDCAPLLEFTGESGEFVQVTAES